MARKRRKPAPTARNAAPAARPAPDATPAANPARTPPTRVQVAAIVVRHAIPLAGLALFDGTVENFLVLSVFDLALAIACIGVIGVAVSTRPVRLASTPADTIGSWVLLAGVGAVATLGLTVMFGWVVALIAAASPQGLWNRALGVSVVSIVGAALPQVVQQYRGDVASGLSEAQRRDRDRPRIGGNLFCAGMIFVLGGFMAQFGHGGVIAMAGVITALLVFRDLRPDLMREVVGRGPVPS
jgi:hypothetical protein